MTKLDHIPSAPTRARRAGYRVLQRKCACGGTPGPTGECAECRKKRQQGLQPKLRVNQPGDRYEQEADRVADQVMQGAAPGLQRLPITPLLQREGDGALTAAPPVVDQVLATPGQAMDGGTRGFMEQRFGYDFSQVRIHADGQAAQSAAAVQARAYTVGSDVVFGAGQYQPSTATGQRLLAHELTHVVQQNGSTGLMQRDDGVPSPDATYGPLTVEQTADQADAACDLQGLCKLNFSNPDVVKEDRVKQVARRCFPSIISIGHPCFDPFLTNPLLRPGAATLPPATTPGTGTTPSTTPAPSSSGGGGLNLDKFTKFKFTWGPATFNIDLPKSASVKLPVDWRGAGRLTFELKATTSGDFTFSITLDDIPYVTIKSTTTISASKEDLKSDLMISSTKKTCTAPSKVETKASLEKAGKKLKTAMTDYNKPIDEGKDEVIERGKRIGDVISGIAGVHSAVEKAKGKCETKSIISGGLMGTAPLSSDSETPGFLGAGLKIEF